MYCILCGRICDYEPGGFCTDCILLISQNNLRVAILSLLDEAAEFCPVHLRERIEKVLDYSKSSFAISL